VWSVGAAGGATGGVGFAKARQRRERRERDRRIDALGVGVLMVIGNVTWRAPRTGELLQTTTKSCAG
jgi:hypothetical protein